MNREEFMAKLKALLGDIPADEREEALQIGRASCRERVLRLV